jgi:hypothetical protein
MIEQHLKEKHKIKMRVLKKKEHSLGLQIALAEEELKQ